MTQTSDATLLFTPPDAPDDHAAPLHDLVADPATGTLHTIFTLTLTPHPRPSKSANKFFCPACPSPLRITQGPLRIICPSCGWDAASTGVSDLSDLLARDAQPYPRLFARIQQLSDALVARPDHDTPRRRASRVAVIQRRRSGLEHLSAAPETRVQRFAAAQAEKERALLRRRAPQTAREYVDVAPLLAVSDVTDLVPVEKRFAADVWFRRQKAARRRVPLPKVVVQTPDGRDIGRIDETGWRVLSGDKVLPCMQAAFVEGALRISVRNERNAAMSAVFLTDGGVRAECQIAAGGEKEVEVALSAAGHTGVVLDAAFSYEADDRAGDNLEALLPHTWCVRVHARQDKRRHPA